MTKTFTDLLEEYLNLREEVNEHDCDCNVTRRHPCPRDELERIAQQLNEALEVKKVMKQCFIFDIDGTLANCEHRRHLVEIPDRCAHGFVFELRRFYNCEHKCVVPKKDWDKFFALAPKDPVIEPVAMVFRALVSRYPILIVSARRAEEREATMKWLRQNNLWAWPKKLYMREPDDKRDDDVFKREILQQIRAEGWEPVGVFDDRKRVVDMWRREGLTCFHVAEGNF